MVSQPHSNRTAIARIALKKEGRSNEGIQRAIEEREKLSKLHLITSPDELGRAISEIDDEDISTSKKSKKKLAIM